jgi:hypothetical protein
VATLLENAGNPTTAANNRLHRLGIGLSVLCLFHCLALPWLLASLPLIALAALPEAARESEWLHAVLIVPVVAISGPMLLRGQPGPLRIVLVTAAFSALIGALFVGNERGEQMLTVLGAMMLMIGHFEAMRRPRAATPLGVSG